MHNCTYVCMYVHIYICTYVHMYVCMHACMHACTYVGMYVCMYTHTHTRVYIHTYIYTHRQVQMSYKEPWQKKFYISIHRHSHVCTRMLVCIRAHTQSYEHRYTPLCKHAATHASGWAHVYFNTVPAKDMQRQADANTEERA